ncbi:unnamed protein product [Auanema sp. JU1783]|nr:unnamed protein product [Auanema sp. JU1783]
MSWLRNLQGQLTDLANEVLSEATEEIDDPNSELQVAKKKCSEFEAQLTTEQRKVGSLEAHAKDLEEQLYATQSELDNHKGKYEDILKSRDSEISKLKVELERIKAEDWEEGFDDDEEEKCADLEKEVQHWKSLYMERNAEPMISRSEHEAFIDKLQALKDTEVASLMEYHANVIAELRESYEDKMATLRLASSSSTSNVDLLDTVLLEKEELLEEKRKLEAIRKSSNDDKPLIVDIIDGSEPSEPSPSSMEMENKLAEANARIERLLVDLKDQAMLYAEIKSQKEEIVSLVEQNEELTNAYNEMNDEYEEFKTARTTSEDVEARNEEMSRRIEFLSATLVEYKERYEICRRENADTSRQLERLNSNFDRIKNDLDEARTKNAEKDDLMTKEVDNLRKELENSIQDRTKLRSDIQNFKAAVGSIDEDLSRLRETNNFLVSENDRLQVFVEGLKEKRKEQETMEDPEALSNYIDSMKNLQDLQKSETSVLQNLLTQVTEQKEALENANKLLEERVALLEEYQELHKKEEQGETMYNDLYKKKMKIIETLNEDLKEKLKTAEETLSSNEKEIEGLNEQLKEALSAITEVTEDATRAKKMADDFEKEITVQQNCVDELIIQNNLLQVQYQEATDNARALRDQMREKDSEYSRLELENARIKTENEVYRNKVETEPAPVVVPVPVSDCYNEETFKRLEGQLLEKESEVLCLRNRVEKLLEEKEEEDGSENVASARIAELEAGMEQLQSYSEELKNSLTEKHKESVEYYNQLVQAVERAEKSDSQLRVATLKEEEAHQLLAKEKEHTAKLTAELQRLKEHLVFVEETSTREAVESEKRETEFRDKIRSLQSAHSAANVNASEATQNYESTVQELRNKLENAEQKLEDWRTKCKQEEHLRKETQDALSSLQSVVRELSIDHEKESASTMHKNLELQSRVDVLNDKLSNALDNVEKLQLDKQAIEETCDSVKETVTSKQHIIEDLESQVEELRSAKSSNENYRVDDATLRQLFLNFFTAPAETKPDIALLLASILEYTEDDVMKIKSAVKPGNKTGKMGDAGASLADQFIRFLENESESGMTAPHLPVDPR